MKIGRIYSCQRQSSEGSVTWAWNLNTVIQVQSIGLSSRIRLSRGWKKITQKDKVSCISSLQILREWIVVISDIVKAGRIARKLFITLFYTLSIFLQKLRTLSSAIYILVVIDCTFSKKVTIVMWFNLKYQCTTKHL